MGSVIVALVLILAIAWVTRDRRNRKLRVGFFLERERFNTRTMRSASYSNERDIDHTIAFDHS